MVSESALEAALDAAVTVRWAQTVYVEADGYEFPDEAWAFNTRNRLRPVIVAAFAAADAVNDSV